MTWAEQIIKQNAKIQEDLADIRKMLVSLGAGAVTTSVQPDCLPESFEARVQRSLAHRASLDSRRS